MELRVLTKWPLVG